MLLQVITMSRLPRPKSPFILAVASAFFLFLFNIFLNSFSADYRIALRDTASYHNTGSLMPLFHLGSELTGEVGVILRFSGACILMAFVIMLLYKKTVSWSLLRKAVLLEGIYYLFNIPFIIYLFVKPYAFANYGAAISYSTQILFVTPIFLTLYSKLKSKNLEITEAAKWGALAITGFIFALWAKHFLLAIYALPLNFSKPVFVIGFLNSALTLLFAGIIMIVVLMPLYKKRNNSFNTKAIGTALILAGLYATIFALLASFTIEYMRWISLIDWWTIIFVVLGIGFLILSKNKDNQKKLT
jgi:hypothetical protein